MLHSASYLSTDGSIQTLKKDMDDARFSYRVSPFQDMTTLLSIISATFILNPCPGSRSRQLEYMNKRKATQPLLEKSAGSVFRNPEGYKLPSGAIIDMLGLKGYCIGDACISNVHANFLVNKCRSTSSDMLELIELVRARVKEEVGVELRPEVLYIHPRSGILI